MKNRPTGVEALEQNLPGDVEGMPKVHVTDLCRRRFDHSHGGLDPLPVLEGQQDADDQEALDDTASVQWFENPVLLHRWWNITLVCSAVGFSLWVISSRSEERYIKILGADARYENDDDEIYVADPTSFESWRQAFIDRHGHDMSVEQEKKLRAKVDKVIDA